MRKLVSALALAVVFAGLIQAASALKPVPGAARVPDSLIEHDIMARFARSKINAEHFTISVHNGIVRIDGKTDVIQHKGVATRLAKAGGAIAVQNRIQISEAARAKAAAKLAKSRGGAAQNGDQVARAVVLQPGAKPH